MESSSKSSSSSKAQKAHHNPDKVYENPPKRTRPEIERPREPRTGGRPHSAHDEREHAADYAKSLSAKARDYDDRLKMFDDFKWLPKNTQTTRDNTQTMDKLMKEGTVQTDWKNQASDPRDVERVFVRMPAWEREAGERSAVYTDKGPRHSET